METFLLFFSSSKSLSMCFYIMIYDLTAILNYLILTFISNFFFQGMVIAFWAEHDSTIQPGPPQLQEKLKQCLTEYVYYDEVAVFFTRLLQESRDFLATLKQYKINVTEFENCAVLTLDQINTLCTTMRSDQLKTKNNLKPKIFELLEERRRGLFQSYTITNFEQNTLNIATQAALAGAVVNLKCLPEKLNPIVKPLMESIKREESEILQKMAARFLTHLLNQIVDRQPCPNNKIVSNLCALLKSDVDFTPKIYRDGELKASDDDANNQYLGIITLVHQQKAKDSNHGGGPVVARGPGRPPLVDLSTEDSNEASSSEDPMRKQCRIQRLGATHAITSICSYFDKDLPQKIPILWQILFEQINKIDDAYVLSIAKSNGTVMNGGSSSCTNFVDDNKTNDLITSLQTIEIAAPHLSVKLHDNLFEILPKLCVLLKHPLKAIRHLVSRCLAKLASINSSKVMSLVMNDVLPLLDEKINYRQGAAETIACIVNELQIRIVPYVVLLVVPLLGRMSDSDRAVRLMSTHCFALLIQLMPLDGTIPDAGELSEELKIRKLKDREFLEYLFSPKTIPNFEVPVKINAELRSYQQAGINWLWFLNKYKLHGILCDDMGLGKTIQTICILAGDHYIRQKEKQAKLPSIVICPPTLTGHWVFEVNKFLNNNYLTPLHYVGLPSDREKLRSKIKNHQLVVASYDIVRKDIDFFSSIHWNYCVLDEGHVIKNGKTKSSKAIKLLIANHRLILSGTPIQNNVLELWSLFDFLMPGFLGTEKQFMTKFSKPILASRDAKSSAKDQEAGALAMESLHRQVLPFLLRRVKEDVLTDLPPKILADMFCELSPLQERLYEDFSKTHLKADIRDCLENIDGNNVNKKTHVFQALR
jgi:TATA-binding protein-associated factor